MNMMPLLIVALVVWAGLFFFTLTVERKVAALEKQVADRLPNR